MKKNMKNIIVTIVILLAIFGVKAQSETRDINFDIAITEATLSALKLEKENIDQKYWNDLRQEYDTLQINACIITKIWNPKTLGYTDMHITYNPDLEYITIIVYHNDTVVKREKYKDGITSIPRLYTTEKISFRVEDPSGKELIILRTSSN